MNKEYKLKVKQHVWGMFYFILQHKTGLISMRSEEYASEAAVRVAVSRISELMPSVPVEFDKSFKKQTHGK